MKIAKRLIERAPAWGETAARIWAAQWVLITGACLIFGSVVLKWVESPFSRNLTGLELPFLRNVGVIPHISILSYGVLGIVVLTAAYICLRLFPPSLALAAAILMTLFVVVPAHIVFEQPALLRRLTDEAEQVPLIRIFTKEYLPQNYGAAEDIPKHLNLYTAWGRLLAGLSFLGLGWYCFGFGSFLIAVYAIRRLPQEKFLTGVTLICLPIGALGILLIRPLIAEHYVTSASIAKAEGHNQEAIAAYRKAMRLDAWHAQDINLYATIGQLQKQAGIAAGSAEQHVSRAVDFKEARQYEPAIFELNRVAEAGGALGETAQRESARTLVDFGLALYRAGGIGAAVTNWQLALAIDPTQVYAFPYLARGNYDIGRYQAALSVIDQLVKIVTDHTAPLGDAYSLGGDCYAKLGREADARHYYNLSLSADSVENHWALTGLIGE